MYKFHKTIISYRSRDHNEHEVILEIALIEVNLLATTSMQKT